MAIAKPVSTSTEPNDDREAQHESRPIPEAVKASANYFPTHIPEGQFSRIRAEARTAKYDNSIQERETIAAVDDAIFERVRPMEQLALANAERLLANTNPDQRGADGEPVGNVVQIAEGHVAELHAIRDALHEGRVSTAELAERYKKVQSAIQYGDANRLLARAQEAKSLAKRLADPLAHTEHILSLMPLGNWRPLGIRNW